MGKDLAELFFQKKSSQVEPGILDGVACFEVVRRAIDFCKYGIFAWCPDDVYAPVNNASKRKDEVGWFVNGYLSGENELVVPVLGRIIPWSHDFSPRLVSW